MPPPLLLRLALTPSPSLPAPPTRLLPRQASTTTAIPALYGSLDSSPDPGAVAGITLGAVGGFLLVLFLIYTCINMGNPPETAESSVTGSVVLEKKTTKRHSHHSHHHHHHDHGHRRSATVEVRRSRVVPAAVIVEERVSGVAGGRIIVEEARPRRSTSRSRSRSSGSRSRSRTPSGRRGPGLGPRIVDLGSDEDEVVVIEEHSPPRRRRSRVRSVERRSGAYSSRRDSSSRG